MRNLNISLLYALVLALAMTRACGSSSVLVESERYFVTITNDMTQNTVNVHCHSKDNDVPAKDVPQFGNYKFTFMTDSSGVTVYSGDFKFTGYQGTFLIFRDDQFFQSRCSKMKECIWSLRNDGAYLFNYGPATPAWELEHPWKPVYEPSYVPQEMPKVPRKSEKLVESYSKVAAAGSAYVVDSPPNKPPTSPKLPPDPDLLPPTDLPTIDSPPDISKLDPPPDMPPGNLQGLGLSFTKKLKMDLRLEVAY